VSKDLVVDEERVMEASVAATGIFVRARRGISFGSYDIAELTRESLIDWLRDGGRPCNERGEQVVLHLLGHRAENTHG
jgi:hypothetical protein